MTVLCMKGVVLERKPWHSTCQLFTGVYHRHCRNHVFFGCSLSGGESSALKCDPGSDGVDTGLASS